MEHKIYHKIRKYKIPKIIRLFLSFILIIFGLFMVLLPIPGSAVIGWGSVIIGFVFILSVENIIHIKKIRKAIIYYIKNYRNKKIRQHKIRDIKKHIKQILKNN